MFEQKQKGGLVTKIIACHSGKDPRTSETGKKHNFSSMHTLYAKRCSDY